MKILALTVAMTAWSLASAISAAPACQADEEAAVRKAVESYVTAFNAADAKTLASLWSPEAVYTNPLSSIQVVGRDEIEQQFTDVFAQTKGIKLEATTHSIEFISPGVAVEHGSAKLMEAEGAPQESNYTAIYVKRDGQWLIDRVTEEDVVQVPSHYENLKELEWMIGRWVDQDDQNTVTTECKWAKNENFLVRSFTVQNLDRIDMSGMQLVGWDPAAKQIRSWVFDSDGGFGQGTWTRKDNRWFNQQSGVLSDGKKFSSVSVFTQLDDDSFTMQATNRMVDGELLPNIEEVKITKEKE